MPRALFIYLSVYPSIYILCIYLTISSRILMCSFWQGSIISLSHLCWMRERYTRRNDTHIYPSIYKKMTQPTIYRSLSVSIYQSYISLFIKSNPFVFQFLSIHLSVDTSGYFRRSIHHLSIPSFLFSPILLSYLSITHHHISFSLFLFVCSLSPLVSSLSL